MYDVMLHEASLWVDEPPFRKRKLEAPPVESPPDSPVAADADYFSDEEEMDPVKREKYRKQVFESCGFDVDFFIHTLGGIIPVGWTSYELQFAKAGLHCYNIEKGKKLEFKSVVKVNAEIAHMYNCYATLEVIDPVDKTVHTFQTLVTDSVKRKKASLVIITKICRIKPQVPGIGDATTFWNSDAVDDFYKGDMPDWPPNNKADLYEVKESELRDNEWLSFYAEVALFSERQCDTTPFEMKKVLVETMEGVQNQLKSSNAVFYMSFKVRGGPECRGIVRKTSDGRTGHMCLEARCWID
jgi:uncharacterized protein (TIGR01572 family)